MKPITLSTIGQKEQIITVAKDAGRKGAEVAIADLEKRGLLNGENAQKLLERGDYVSTKIQEFINSLFGGLIEQKTTHTKLISGGEALVIEATDGTGVITDESNLFVGHIDSDFGNWKTNVKGLPRGKQKIAIHEQTANGTLRQIFGSLNQNPNALCLTQDQIIKFFKEKQYTNYLIHEKEGDHGYGYFLLLFKVGDEFFVAGVRVNSDGSQYARVYRFSYDYVWGAGYRHRVVVLQQNP